MDRRDFLKRGGMGVAAIVVGQNIPSIMDNPAFAAGRVQSLRFRITDAMKEMVTHNAINDARCYFWIFKEERFPADCPGPIVFCTEGETIEVTLTNDLDEPHAFAIKGVVDSGPIAPGATRKISFRAPRGGTYLYFDPLNQPVNRVMGLHGALVAMPRRSTGKHPTPYSAATPAVQRLFDDLGVDRGFPGLAWHQGDPVNHTPAFRQHVWILHEASPILFSEVGNYHPGLEYPADQFLKAFNDDPYANTFETGVFNRKPHFFTVNGQSGYFIHESTAISPYYRVGEPVLVRILNAGLWTHSLHAHANHIYVTSMNGVVQSNLPNVDTMTIGAAMTMDWLFPYTRPADVPNQGGIGYPDPPMIGINGRPVWPPNEELAIVVKPENVNAEYTLSPLCYPMHDHIETSQGSQGGNYSLGMLTGFVFTGDRTNGRVLTFPGSPHPASLNRTGPAAPPLSHHPHGEPL
jgi:hypothetical protein